MKSIRIFSNWWQRRCAVCGGHGLFPFWPLQQIKSKSSRYNPEGNVVFIHEGSCEDHYDSNVIQTLMDARGGTVTSRGGR